MPSVLIVDDSPIFCLGMTRLLEADPDIRVIGVAGDVKRALQMVQTHRPEIVLVDLRLRLSPEDPASTEAGGISLLERLQEYPEVRAIVLTGHAHPGWVRRLHMAGAMAFLDKDSGETEICRVVRLVAQGYEVWSNEQMKLLSGRTLQLTEREQEILNLTAMGLSDQAIGQRLRIHPKTVSKHLENIRAKLGVQNRHEAVQRARRLGLLPPTTLQD